MADNTIHDANELTALTAQAIEDARTRRARVISPEELEGVHGGALVLERTLINGKLAMTANLLQSPLTQVAVPQVNVAF